ncbi:hypothetical protein LTR56_012499 [Elasticomyces elasticus]|nr:hypothetical protein LTR56_012499 [Elasticomyces elasticus]KAK3666222.1 hypothetical protein LTR22_002886 [Elasticomyces elasticus]KAK4926819.1 hypothetical protein LTR49_006235 [Elasticomyces elasticus]KAK5763654.1 hypothetical protein LTS12_006211 [Elasticomyces elasticus]
MEPSALLRLPAELRNQIYELALYQECGIVMRLRRKGWLWKRPVLCTIKVHGDHCSQSPAGVQVHKCRLPRTLLGTHFFLLSCDVSPAYSAKQVAKTMRTPHEFLAWLSQRHTPVDVRGLIVYIGKHTSLIQGPTGVALPILSEFAKTIRHIDVQCDLELDHGEGYSRSRVAFPVLKFGAVFTAAAHLARTSMRESAVLDCERQFTERFAQELEGAAEHWVSRGIGSEKMVNAMAVAVAQRCATWNDDANG